MPGILYGVGVGPGDPELMTLKAVRLAKEADVIVVPGKEVTESVAYKIAIQAVPEIADKELVPVYMPMTHDLTKMHENHNKGAKQLEVILDQGKNVVFLTLGDSTIFCTFSYLQEIIEADGYTVELVSGIPSFCAAAARTNTPISVWKDLIHIVPAVHTLDTPLDQAGTYVLMKSGSHMKEVKEKLAATGRDVVMVENCGMPNEHVYRGVDAIPDDAGYFSLIIAKEHKA